MPWFFSVIPYVLAAGTIALGVFTLLKEWGEYPSSRLRRSVLFAYIIVGALTFVSLYRDNEDKKKSAEDIKGLKGQVQAANDAQKDNTILFVNSFSRMSAQVSDLKTEVKTEALQKKLASVQAELLNTQKALAPGPKAELAFTFAPFPNTPPGQPIITVTDVTLPLNQDGSVHVEFSILNKTEVEAVDAELNVQICDGCKYAKEPPGLSKLPGLADTHRYLLIPRLFAMMAYRTLSVDVILPPSVQTFAVGFGYRCHTCILPTGPSQGIVHITRP
jgi:hypothetical protein